jgi:TPR repeat protein
VDDGDFQWAQLAADQGSRRGIVELGHCYFHGRGCAVDRARALELTRVAAELDCPRAQHSYGHYGFGERDWQRYYWYWRASERRIGVAKSAREIIGFLPSFEKGELGRILQLAVPLIRKSFAYAVPDWPTEQPQVDQLLRVELHEAMLDRVRQAIACWSMVGQRCGVAQDVRIMITTMLWTEPWRWGAKRTEEQPESPQKKAKDDPAV